MNCPECGRGVDTFSNYCRHCGARIPDTVRGIWREYSAGYMPGEPDGIVVKERDGTMGHVVSKSERACLMSTLLPGSRLIHVGEHLRGIFVMVSFILSVVVVFTTPGLYMLIGFAGMVAMWVVGVSWTHCACVNAGLCESGEP